MDIYQILRVRRDAGKAELQAKYLRMLDTYRMVADFAEDQDVARIARLKLNQLLAAGKEYHLYGECPENAGGVTPQTEIAAIKLALNSQKASGGYLSGSSIPEKIDRLPESAEKHYLKATVILKMDGSLNGCREAVPEIQKALALDPSNAAYSGLLDAIEAQVNDYAEQQRLTAEMSERARAEQERRSQQALDEARGRQFWNGVGSSGGGLAGCLCCAAVWCFASGGC